MPRDVNKNESASQPTSTELSVHMIYLTAGRINLYYLQYLDFV